MWIITTGTPSSTLTFTAAGGAAGQGTSGGAAGSQGVAGKVIMFY